VTFVAGVMEEVVFQLCMCDCSLKVKLVSVVVVEVVLELYV